MINPLNLEFPPILQGLWGTWTVIWLAGAIRNKRTQRRQSARATLAYRLPIMAGLVLILLPPSRYPLTGQVFARAAWLQPMGAILVALGLAFTVWARWRLGRNWSGSVTVKQDHKLIESGPYRWVRHPIYTGLLVALAGTALVNDHWLSYAGIPPALFGMWRKWKAEESFMRETFGEAYRAYTARTRALIPLIW